MNDTNAFVAAIEARVKAERDAEQLAESEGGLLLEDLWKRLQPFQSRYGVHIDMEERPGASEKGVVIARDGNVVARWTRRGRVLIAHFPRNPRRAPEEAIAVEQAFEMTIELLVREQHRAPDPGPRALNVGTW